jgi:type II secretory pathway component PulF
MGSKASAGCQVCGNARVRSQIDDWVSAMSQGAAIPDAATHADLPRLVSRMLSTAIQTPDLAEVLRFLGRYYATRFSRAIALLEAPRGRDRRPGTPQAGNTEGGPVAGC